MVDLSPAHLGQGADTSQDILKPTQISTLGQRLRQNQVMLTAKLAVLRLHSHNLQTIWAITEDGLLTGIQDGTILMDL